jgi:phosphoribosylaminoimidazole (AIR) synthetase
MVLVVPEEHDEEVVARAGEIGMPAFAIGAVRA